MASRIAHVKLFSIGQDGNILDASSTLGDHMTANTEHRIIEDIANTPNSSDNPTIEEYIGLENGDGYSLDHMDQYIIVTSN